LAEALVEESALYEVGVHGAARPANRQIVSGSAAVNHTADVRILIVGVAAVLLCLIAAPMASAQPVSERHSESPYIEGFYRQLEAQGFGYLDDIDGNNLFNTVAWNACRMYESTSRYTAAALIKNYGYSADESAAIMSAGLDNGIC
jgi:hypothetical protein